MFYESLIGTASFLLPLANNVCVGWGNTTDAQQQTATLQNHLKQKTLQTLLKLWQVAHCYLTWILLFHNKLLKQASEFNSRDHVRQLRVRFFPRGQLNNCIQVAVLNLMSGV